MVVVTYIANVVVPMIIVLAIMLAVMTVLLLWVLYCYNKLWDSIYELNNSIKKASVTTTTTTTLKLNKFNKDMSMSSEDVAKYVKEYLDKK